MHHALYGGYPSPCLGGGLTRGTGTGTGTTPTPTSHTTTAPTTATTATIPEVEDPGNCDEDGLESIYNETVRGEVAYLGAGGAGWTSFSCPPPLTHPLGHAITSTKSYSHLPWIEQWGGQDRARGGV